MSKISRSRSNNSSLLTNNGTLSKTDINEDTRLDKTRNSSIDIKHTPFTDTLNEIEINFNKEELAKDLEYIKDLGKKLCKNPNLNLLESYKKRVQAFLKEALNKIYKVENKEGLKKPGQEQKIYIYVNNIDEELKNLTAKFIEEQQEALDLIKTVEGIQGLLYNIIA
ncbi:MAG: YaaR family protein [Fusobacteria bacterium]|nr:YaaR family protein [Fusobacteriota bacterium]